MFSALRNPNRERGQMLVIVALGLTVLIAMAGLIIDGGMALSNRRQVQNAADAAALAGTRVLGLDLKWRADNRPPPAPFANVDQEVCDAINDALVYNTNAAQSIAAIDCYAGSDDAQYVDFDRNVLGRVGDGVPPVAQGVRVAGTGASGTFLMGVIGIDDDRRRRRRDRARGPWRAAARQPDAVRRAEPARTIHPGQPVPDPQRGRGRVRDGRARQPPRATWPAPPAWPWPRIVQPKTQDRPFAAPSRRPFPWRCRRASTFTTSITVTLSAEGNGGKIHYTTDGSTPTAASAKYTAPLTFTATTTLKAIAVKGGEVSEIGTFNYTQATPPAVVTATPGDGTVLHHHAVGDADHGDAGLDDLLHDQRDRIRRPRRRSTAGAISLSASTQIRAMAWKGGVNSAVTVFNYTKSGGTQPPVANPVSGTEFATTLNVSLTTPTPGATIWYTLNGSDPRTSPSRTQYVPPLSLVSTTTVTAYATAGGNDSLVVDVHVHEDRARSAPS